MRNFSIRWTYWCCLICLISLCLSSSAQTVVHIPPPGPLTKTFKGKSFTFKYPSNWKILAKEPSVSIGPNGSFHTLQDGSTQITHGLMMGFFQPTAKQDLEQTTNQLMYVFAQNNPGLQELSQYRTADQIGQHKTILLAWTNPNGMYGPEGGALLTVAEEHGIWYWVFVAPAVEIETYEETFSRISESIKFSGGETSQPATHSLHQTIVDRIVKRLEKNKFQLPQFRILISNQNDINAYAMSDQQLVVLPTAMIEFLAGSEGELAFIIAHELGHISDRECAAALRTKATLSKIRFCEARADELGLQYLVGAGYNPYDAAAFFGRMMMFTGETSLWRNFWRRFTSDHPIDLDRINALRNTMLAFCRRFPAECRSTTR